MLETQNSGATAKLSAMSTPPDSAPELPASAPSPVESAASDVSSPPAPSASHGARRARLLRKRRRQGLRPVQVLLHRTDIEAMIRLGHLKEEELQDAEALGRAVYGVVDLFLDNAKVAIARGRAPRRNV